MKRRIWILLLLLLAGFVLVLGPGRDALMAVRMARALNRLASGDSGRQLPVESGRVERRQGGRGFSAVVYRPSGRLAECAVVLIPGISEQGVYHPRLVSLSRALADIGFLVLTPDIREFREFRIAPDAMEEIAFWCREAPAVPGGERIEKTGLAGISFSGTLALITAARPDLRDQAAFVLAIGPYDNPLRCSREWFGAGPVSVGPGYYPTRYYARWIMMLAALDLLPDEGDRVYLHGTLIRLLLQQPVDPPRKEISGEVARWFRLATMPEDESDAGLAQRIERHLVPLLYDRITPDRAAAEVRCPVFLVHGAHDDLIPTDESVHLRDRIARARTFLLITPFLTHTHPFSQPLSRMEKAKAIAGFMRFFYAFARETR